MSQSYLFEPAPRPTVPIVGMEMVYPVRRIYCVGRNYADHAREMGHDPDREPPFFFSKPADALVVGSAPVAYPPLTKELHYEGELVVALARGGRNLNREEAAAAISGFAVGNDLTRRDMQAEAKALRRPWDLSKGFDGSAVVGPISLADRVGVCARGRIASYVNDELRQDADLGQMIWPVIDVIQFLSHSVTLAAGDLIMTGTPSGVGRLERGDVVRVEIENLEPIETHIL
ncbi:fumarylacetoacetate hydrolase family protein [Donghicola sp. XS_ASV15]|uniref:fumarylacetoacetate hydrolase family protein n=1 Tax=Donghicola sp. XS_ASV15 TaxID=3241295 RepID=UPI0035165796